MIKAQVLTNWKNTAGTNSPALTLQTGDSAMDVTGQQNVMPSPNAVIWEIWTDDITPYEADSDLTILWTEVIPDESP